MGPLFWHELRQLGRRGRLYFLRLALLLLAAGLWLYYYSAIPELARSQAAFAIKVGGQVFTSDMFVEVNAGLLSRMTALVGSRFQLDFVTLTAVLALSLAPLLVTGGILTDRYRGTLDLLLTTDLNAWEVVLGKTLPRVLLLGVLAMSMMVIPMLAHVQGGIDVSLLLASTLVLLSMLLSLAALTTWLCTWSGLPATVVLLTSYSILIGWLWLGSVNWLFSQPELHALLPWINGAALLEFLRRQLTLKGTLGDWPWQLAGVHALAHVIVALVMLGLASRGLRRRYQPPTASRPGQRWWRRHRPPFSERWPLLWKERGVVSRWTWVVWLTLGAAMVLYLAFDLWLHYPTSWKTWRARQPVLERLARLVGIYIGYVAMFVPTFLVAFRAAWSLRVETDRSTWETLLSTPTSLRSLLRAKWWGALLATAPALVGLTLALLASLSLSLAVILDLRTSFPNEPWTQEPLVWRLLGPIGAVFLISVLAAFAASVGLLMSVVCATGLRALIATFLTLLTFFGFPWFLTRWLDGRLGGETLLGLINALEGVTLLGIPTIGVLTLGIFNARLRRWFGFLWRVLAVPILVGMILQVPIFLLALALVLHDQQLGKTSYFSALSPNVFMDTAMNHLLRQYFVDEAGAYSLTILPLYLLLAYALWLIACLLAARRSERLGDRPPKPLRS